MCVLTPRAASASAGTRTTAAAGLRSWGALLRKTKRRACEESLVSELKRKSSGLAWHLAWSMERCARPRSAEPKDRNRPILLKNSFALPGRTPHRKVDRSECATSDASEPGKGWTTPRIHSESRTEEFFNGIGHEQTFKRNSADDE